MFIPRQILQEKLVKLLTDDVGQGDITSAAVISKAQLVKAEVLAKAEGIVAGVEEAKILAETMGIKVNGEVADGDQVKQGQIILDLSGDAATILLVERTLLNLLSRMSGIATATKTLVEKIQKANLKTRIAATRKTVPGLLYFDKKAVAIGGGDTHRLHLDDMILIKDNHIICTGSLEKALKHAKANASFTKKIEVEVSTPEEALKAAKLGADLVMLDNFNPEQIRNTVNLFKKAKFFGEILLEASGGITSENIMDFASTGVDLISLGELTHSVKALDISLEILPTK